MDPKEFLARLDKADNEDEVRQRLAGGQYGEHHKSLAQEWLRRKEEARVSASAAKRDAREEETLAISKRATAISEEALSMAKEANRIASEDLEAARTSAASAREQAKWAKWAAVIATIAAIISVKDQIVALVISLLP